MRLIGIDGVRRGKHRTVTTESDPKAPRHPDHVKRRWALPSRPDQWWVADFTYVWTPAGFVVNQRGVQREFWKRIGAGMESEAAAVDVGVSTPVGTRWFRDGAACHRSV